MNIARLKVLSADPLALQEFYRRAFDAGEAPDGCLLGAERIEIAVAADPRPELFLSNETGFQHFALVVADMRRAYAQLSACAGWRPISLAGPERLPKTSGGATAFKFRDPEGRPLELLQFPPDAIPPLWRARFEADPQRLFHGIDHTGITIRDAGASAAFWARLGLEVAHRQLNQGPEQARLDAFAAVADAEVEIVSLSPPGGLRPGVEMLCYRRPPTATRAAPDLSTAATRIVLSAPPPPGAGDRDPDGHRLAFARA
jgi:catechol 2,3-dioxygenase-like lactoylglutathione lyase family enzyme